MSLPKILKTKITRENLALAGILIILVAIPLTVILLGIRQELRKRAVGVNGAIVINERYAGDTEGVATTNSRNVTLTLTAPSSPQSFLKIPQAYAANYCGGNCSSKSSCPGTCTSGCIQYYNLGGCSSSARCYYRDSRNICVTPAPSPLPLDPNDCDSVCRSKGYDAGYCYAYSSICANWKLGPCEVLGLGLCDDFSPQGRVYVCSCASDTTPPYADLDKLCYDACRGVGYNDGACKRTGCGCKDGMTTGLNTQTCGELNQDYCAEKGRQYSPSTNWYHCCCYGGSPKPTPKPTEPPVHTENGCSVRCSADPSGFVTCNITGAAGAEGCYAYDCYGSTACSRLSYGGCGQFGHRFCHDRLTQYPGRHTIKVEVVTGVPKDVMEIVEEGGGTVIGTCSTQVDVKCPDEYPPEPTPPPSGPTPTPGGPTPTPGGPTPTPTPPSGVEAMMISDFENFQSSYTGPFTTTKSWTLTEGDGLKTVWARFKVDGVWTEPVFDTITLDTGAGPTPTPTPTGPTPTPTPPPGTPTPTPTPPPGGYLKLDLLKVWFWKQEKVLGRGHEGAVILALKQGNNVVLEKEVKLDENGEARDVELPGVTAGTYYAFIYEPGYLTKKLTNVSIGAGGNELDFTKGETEYFLVGDFNGDQEVNILDFSIFVKSYGKSGEE